MIIIYLLIQKNYIGFIHQLIKRFFPKFGVNFAIFLSFVRYNSKYVVV